MKTRIAFLSLIFSFISFGVYAQQEKPGHVNQFGINFSSLNSFGIHYKTGTEKTLLRLSLLTLDLGAGKHWGRPADSLENKEISYGAGFRLGFEKHVTLAPKFDFIWGVEAGCNYSYQKQKTESKAITMETSAWWVSPLANLILGATCKVSDHVVIGAEITPGIIYSYGKATNTSMDQTLEQTNSKFDFGFSNNYASLSLAYRFGK
ncbi:MAG: hypothetical protein NT040_10245 [Bacteroidetes bacterium]|nr:hypothetical protein [Bacteroidota bacterium]